MGYIYKITNKINQKVYIGLTSRSIEQRWQEHLRSVETLKEKRPLYWAIAKYGKDNFTIEQIEEVENDFLGEREMYWIHYYDSYNNGYNVTLGGDGTHTRQIDQYNLSGELIASYNNITEAIETMQISESVIRGACNKKYKTAKGYILKYHDDPTPIEVLITNAQINNYSKKEVCQYDLSGKLINVWSSITSAEAGTGISNISRGINHSKPVSGFVWRTKNTNFYDNLDLTSIIVQVSIEDDTILGYYDSFLSAAKALGKKTGSAISESCRNIGYHKTAYGYKWRYLKDVL